MEEEEEEEEDMKKGEEKCTITSNLHRCFSNLLSKEGARGGPGITA